MAYIRQGECSRCGDCCVSHQEPDGAWNNAWPADLATATASWSAQSLDESLPLFRWLEHPKAGKTSGRLRVGQVNTAYVWSTQYGLVKSEQEAGRGCPALLGKAGDALRPCGLVGTQAEIVFTLCCAGVPPQRFETAERLAQWQRNCPGCSYTWVEEPE